MGDPSSQPSQISCILPLRTIHRVINILRDSTASIYGEPNIILNLAVHSLLRSGCIAGLSIGRVRVPMEKAVIFAKVNIDIDLNTSLEIMVSRSTSRRDS